MILAVGEKNKNKLEKHLKDKKVIEGRTCVLLKNQD